MLKAVASVGALSAFPKMAYAQGMDRRESIRAYLETLARPDGGYGWEGQGRSHLSPTYFVIGSYRALKLEIPRAKALAEFVRSHHPAALKKLEQERRIFDWQQVQALTWLGADTSELKAKFLQWQGPLAYLKQYERDGNPLFSSEMGVILGRSLLGIPASELPATFGQYLNERRRENGSFNNTPAKDGSDGHVTNTWWGLQALMALGRLADAHRGTAQWLRSCQLSSGGFTFAPKPEFGGIEDVAYTWAALRALKALGSRATHERAAIEWLHSLANSDGGFADRPGWLSNPMATFYALEALETVGGFGQTSRRHVPARRIPIPSDLNVFSIQLEAHGRGSPVEAVDLARALKIDLWGAKNATPQWLATAQSASDAQKAGVNFFVSNEEYGTWVKIAGQGTYSHTSDIIAPARAEIGDSMAGQRAVSWDEFQKQRVAALHKGQGRLVWQFGENEELVRMFLDDSLQRDGYAAISTYHFGNPDFTNSEPFLHRWRGQIPFVALQDAHGPEPWWFADMTAGFRTLFLAKEASWAGWLEALKLNRVVAVRRDQWTGGQTWMHGASGEALEFVRKREMDWRWWENPGISRPLVSIVAVRPGDEFEVARPENGVTLRIRCAWQNTPQGLLKQPISEFVSLQLDGNELKPQLFSKRRPNGLYDDFYHHVHLTDLKPGKHFAKVVVRSLEANRESERTLEFVT